MISYAVDINHNCSNYLKYLINQSRGKGELSQTALAAQPCRSISQYTGAGFHKGDVSCRGERVLSLAGYSRKMDRTLQIGRMQTMMLSSWIKEYLLMLDLLNWESQLVALQLLKHKYNQMFAQPGWYMWKNTITEQCVPANTGRGLKLLPLSFSSIIWEVISIKEEQEAQKVVWALLLLLKDQVGKDQVYTFFFLVIFPSNNHSWNFCLQLLLLVAEIFKVSWQKLHTWKTTQTKFQHLFDNSYTYQQTAGNVLYYNTFSSGFALD